MVSISSAPIEVGLRRHLNLAGDWNVVDVKVWEPGGAVPQRSDKWKLGETPKTIHLPGALPFDAGFRGWVTLKREITWPADKVWQPRAISFANIQDSVKARVNGEELPETLSVQDIDFETTKWAEHHSPFKGFDAETRIKRCMLMARSPDRFASIPVKALDKGKAEIELTIRGTSGDLFGPKLPYGIQNDVRLELTPPVQIKNLAFDTDKPGEKRRMKFLLTIANETGKEFKGKIRSVYGSYDGKVPYTGTCRPYATVDQDVVLKPGSNQVEVIREETPRFATCLGTFIVLDRKDAALDAAQQRFHTAAIEIRDRRELWLNNDRFFIKGQGSFMQAPIQRRQFQLMGGNTMRGPRDQGQVNMLYSEGILSSAGAALLASCERCIFWDPKDTSNIYRAARQIIRDVAECPGIIEWEVTNEMYGETTECRKVIQDAFHKYDPYHRPIVATKGSGEWEAVAENGRVEGTDIVGCQYLSSKEGVDSVLASITEQPITCTEINWFDPPRWTDPAMPGKNLWQVWLDKGLAGTLLFDYSGNALFQPLPMVPEAEAKDNWNTIDLRCRNMFQDLVADAVLQADGTVVITLGNRMPYPLHNLVINLPTGKLAPRTLAAGEQLTLVLPREGAPEVRSAAVVRAEYETHGGLPHVAILAPLVTPAPTTEGGRK